MSPLTGLRSFRLLVWGLAIQALVGALGKVLIAFYAIREVLRAASY